MAVRGHREGAREGVRQTSRKRTDNGIELGGSGIGINEHNAQIRVEGRGILGSREQEFHGTARRRVGSSHDGVDLPDDEGVGRQRDGGLEGFGVEVNYVHAG